MRKIRKIFPLILIPFMVLGCSEEPPIIEPTDNGNNNENSNDSNNNQPSVHTHSWSGTWSKNETEHWKECTGTDCNELNGKQTHVFNERLIVSAETLGITNSQYETYYKEVCSICGYTVLTGIEKEIQYKTNYKVFDKIPVLKFTTDAGTSFATTPTDTSDKPEVSGAFSMSDAPSQYNFSSLPGKMKVRGNQTARFSKKGFRLKFDSKTNLLGLNNGLTYKKWVVFAEAKDSSLLRNSLAMYLSQNIFGENVFVSDFTPINLYINNQYWGVYILAEQKEVGSGRIEISTPSDNYDKTDIGYCFELDNYASREDAATGDPTFTVTYKPKEITYQVESGQSNVLQHSYTLLSEITNSDTQLPYLKNRVELLYEILYRAAVNNELKEIENETLVNSSETDVETVISKYFDIDTFVDSYLLNEIACNPDVGYSSFYMSLDMSSTGNKKLRFDCPWDWDSAFGIRKNCKENADGLFLTKSTNMWFNLFSKMSFFVNKVKDKWNKLRNECLFENAIHMLDVYTEKYGSYYDDNFVKWPNCIGNASESKNELRTAYLNVSNQQQAMNLLKKWFGKRIDYLESQFGANRDSILSSSTPDYSSFKANATKTRYEAEEATLSGGCGSKSSTNSNVSNGAYVNNLDGHNGASMTFTINSPKACTALLVAGLSARQGKDYDFTDLFSVKINAKSYSPNDELLIPAGTGGRDYQYWMTSEIGYINLNSGVNTLVITANATSTNFDFIDLYIPN